MRALRPAHHARGTGRAHGPPRPRTAAPTAPAARPPRPPRSPRASAQIFDRQVFAAAAGSDDARRLATLNPEQWYRRRFRQLGLLPRRVRRFERVMFTCAAAGDTSRWKRAGRRVPEGVRLKYTTEYRPALETCARRAAGALKVE